jgi:hypothetical protein
MGGDETAARDAVQALCDTWRDSDSGCGFSRDRTLMVYTDDGTAARLTEPQLRAVLDENARLEQQRDEARMQLTGAQARIDYFESRVGAVHTMALLEAENARTRKELERRRQEQPGRGYLANAYANGWADAIAAYRPPGWIEREAGWRKFLGDIEAAPQQPARDAPCVCGCGRPDDDTGMCHCPTPCPCEPDCGFCLVPNPMRKPARDAADGAE